MALSVKMITYGQNVPSDTPEDTLKEMLRGQINAAIEKLAEKAGVAVEIPNYSIEIPKDTKNGDFAANAAMQLARAFKKKPADIAQDILDAIEAPFIERAEVAGPGFLNFFINRNYFHSWLKDLLGGKDLFTSTMGNGKKMQVEFVSANPTGPLHIGHGRGAAFGDSLARVLKAAGFTVQKEYYINDAGNQMNNLGKSFYARAMEQLGKEYPFPEDGYQGDYISDIAADILKAHPELPDMPEADGVALCLEEGKNAILDEIRDHLEEFQVTFDNWFSEKSLYTDGQVDETLEQLKKDGFLYEKDGASWFPTTPLGDDKDRVVRRANGELTYFASDIAYHRNKFITRGFDTVVDVWGADHHGYIKRMECGVHGVGVNPERLKVVLIQMVNLVQGGERISMSTRAGKFITLKWLVDEVGADAARYFYNMRSHDSQFDFDIDLAKSKTNDNPVYYIQYAHARVASLLRKAEENNITVTIGEGLERLDGDDAIELIKKMYDLRNIIEVAARHREPHRIAYYLQELAGQFHTWYYNNPVINEDDLALTNARLSLAVGVGSAIKYGLELLGVSAPERM